MSTVQPLVGKRREQGEKPLTDLSAGDPWAEAPFFAVDPDGTLEHEHITGWRKDSLICGIFHGVRVANKQGPANKQRPYAVFMDDDGNRFRVYTPGQLQYQLKDLPVGTYVEMTYLGKDLNERDGVEYHNFKTLANIETN